MPAPHALYSKMLAEQTASRNVLVLLYYILFCLELTLVDSHLQLDPHYEYQIPLLLFPPKYALTLQSSKSDQQYPSSESPSLIIRANIEFRPFYIDLLYHHRRFRKH
jgi:hypothetical protein